MRLHGPIAATVAAASATYLLLLAFDAPNLASTPFQPEWLVWLLAGVLYTQLFESWAHRVPMHRGLPGLAHVRRAHLEHHRIFHGDNFRTRQSSDLGYVAGRWWMFPLLLLGHFAVLRPIASAAATSMFLLGCLAHYLLFEITHWFTHVEDNGFDRFLTGMPGLAALRARQIEHHRLHHEAPQYAFNFMPPYLGDRLVGLLPPEDEFVQGPLQPALPRAEVDPVPEPVSMSVSALRPWTRPMLRYGSALALGAAVVGLALFAHGRWAEGRVPPASGDTVV